LTAATDPSEVLPAPRLYRARVAAVERIAGDTQIIRAETEGGAAIPFRAGQYAMLHAEGAEPRAFSFAAAPQGGRIEFHIKGTGRGISARIFDGWQEGHVFSFEAPFGDHYWRPSSRPLLALAGGVGIAPLKAIIEAHLDHAETAPAHLYWGVRDAAHLYLDDYFEALRQRHPRFHYVPLLANAGATGLRAGFTGPAAREDFATFAGFNIYMAGPAAMVEATLPLLFAHGAEKEHIFSDAFGP
jgi:NAD(P)H-flavin reductase